MLTLILIALAGAAANLVDGGIGMGFGVTSTTMLCWRASVPRRPRPSFIPPSLVPRPFLD